MGSQWTAGCLVAVSVVLFMGALARDYPDKKSDDSYSSQQQCCSAAAASFGAGDAAWLTPLCLGCASSYGDVGACQQCLVQSYAAAELPLSTRAQLAGHCLSQSTITPDWKPHAGAVQQCMQGARKFGVDAVGAFDLCVSCVLSGGDVDVGACQHCLQQSADYSAVETCYSPSQDGGDWNDDNGDDDYYTDDDKDRSPEYWYNLFEEMGHGLTHVDLTPILPNASSIPRTVYFAVGTQNYTCANATGPFKAAGALARLYNVPQSNLTGMHFFNAQGIPTWEITGKGSVTGRKLADVPSANPASAPDLLLEVTSSCGVFAGDTFINRVITAGGRAPQRNCSAAGETANVPYTTYYVFYHHKH